MATLVAMLISAPFLRGEPGHGWGLQLVYVSVLLAAVYALRKHRRHFVTCVTLALAGLLLNIAGISARMPGIAVAGDFFYMFFHILFIQAIINDVLKAKRVTQDTFCGAVCAYLMLGIFFASIYKLIEFFVPGSFIGVISSDGNSYFNFIYFSFTALTTTGFGDITPVTECARVTVILETVTGVFYMGILVSHLVSGVKKENGKPERISSE